MLLLFDSSAWSPLVWRHQFHELRSLEHEPTRSSGIHNHYGNFWVPFWPSAGFETYKTQQKGSLYRSYICRHKHIGVYEVLFVLLSVSYNNYWCTDFNFQHVQTLSPGVDLPVKVVVALVELLDISFLPLNVRTVLLELGGHGVTAVFGCTQVLLSLSNDRPLSPQIWSNILPE